MANFRKRPVVIEAVQWDGTDAGFSEVRSRFPEVECGPSKMHGGDCLIIGTLEGVMEANKHDWIIRGVKGEVYPCKPDIFAATYEPATNADAVARSAASPSVPCRWR